MLLRLDDDDTFPKHVAFPDEGTFHVCGKVNRHNSRIWGSENPREVMELERGTPILNVWCALTTDFE
jgi:hypothetical protein